MAERGTDLDLETRGECPSPPCSGWKGGALDGRGQAAGFPVDLSWGHGRLWVREVLAAQSCLTLWPQGLWPTSLLCPWDSPGKNTGVGSHSFLQGVFLPWDWTWVHCRQILYACHQGSPWWQRPECLASQKCLQNLQLMCCLDLCPQGGRCGLMGRDHWDVISEDSLPSCLSWLKFLQKEGKLFTLC